MKQFLLRVSLFGVLLFAIIWILVFCTNPQSKLFTYSYINKMQRLDTLSSPRVIFVGGSNVAFGLNSPMIADSLHRNVQNTGVHASIGLKFMLEDLEPHLREGDEIIIMPEWSQFTSNYYGSNESLTDVVMYNSPSSFRRLNLQQWITFISYLPKHINNKLMFRIVPGKFNYTSLGFNDLGDEISHYAYPHVNYIRHNIPVSDETASKSSIESFYEIKERFENKGYKIHLFPPVMGRSGYIKDEKLIKDVELKLLSKGIKFDIPAQRHVFPDSMTFDTYYHLGKNAVDSVSKMIIRQLRDN